MKDSTVCATIRLSARGMRGAKDDEPGVWDRQERVPGFDQARLGSLCVALIGAGGLDGEVGEGFARKGVGCLKVFDQDFVERSNLNRQRFFVQDLGEPKAWALVRNLAREATNETHFVATRLSFEEAVAAKCDTVSDVAVCGVDSVKARLFVARHMRQHRTPVVFLGVSEDANHGYVMVQETTGPCFGCAFPDLVATPREPCPNTPAVKEILKAVAALALYAVDSLVMKRKRSWNYRELFLDGSVPERCLKVERRRGCRLCAGS